MLTKLSPKMDYWSPYYPFFRGESPAPYRALPVWMGTMALTQGSWLPCQCCVEWDETAQTYTAARDCFVPLNQHEDGMGLYDVVEDMYWSCPHAEVFYGEFEWPCFLYANGQRYMSWADIGEEIEALKIAAAGGVEALKAAEAEELKHAVLNPQDPGYMVKHMKKMEVDEEYKESSEMAAWLSSIEDKKRMAGKDWDLKVMLPCKYAVRIWWNEKGKQEKVVTHEYMHPFLNRKAKHFHAECWMHEYVDPKTKKAMTPHKCNCLHPGQPGWDDKWLVDPSCTWVYDRYEDWWKYTYSMEEKRWVYDNNRRKEYADRVRTSGGAKAAPPKVEAAKPKTEAKSKTKTSSSDDGWHTVLPQDARTPSRVSHATVWETAGRAKARK